MNSSDGKTQMFDPRPRSELMSSDNYEVPQIVKPAVAVSPIRDKEPTRGVRQSNRGIRGCDHRVEILGLPIYPDSSDEEEEKKLLTRGSQLVHWPLAKEAVINTQQKNSASETEEVIRNPIRKALKPQNEPKLYEQSTTGHRELMDKLKAPEAKISLVPTTVTHDPWLHCSFHSNNSSHIHQPIQLKHYVKHTSPEVT
ncbi:hypothetical protein GCK72_023012 [Caenorhabditis remanei]|uniref:Uncharacterized protein n=1 Tax=Caenorhabditis remanei TaxID=31234 RepID=A0A6A5FVL0_CAERE|nr:hypothetical protein GCK72_023012 [Caenorhabditis remanei]KAF1746555.1 hypothetical protein GCK72_023012 [Caenorhabditis remanei]